MCRTIFNNIKRSIKKGRLYFVIAQLCLVIGLACSFFIALFVYQQFHINRCHSNGGEVYRIISDANNTGAIPLSPYPLAPTLKRDLPEIRSYSRIYNLKNQISLGEEKLPCELMGVDTGVVDIFTFRFIEGGEEQLFKDNSDLALSASMAKRIFPGGNALGSTLEWEIEDTLVLLKVKAIYEDFTKSSTFKPDALTTLDLSVLRMSDIYKDKEFETKFRYRFYSTYLRLNKRVDMNNFMEKLESSVNKYYNPAWKTHLDIQNLYDIYLKSSHLKYDIVKNGNIAKIWMISLLGFLILFVGTANFIVLSIAQSSWRYDELGIRIVHGASRARLITLSVTEFVILSILAFPFACLILKFLPYVNQLINTDIWFDLNHHWQILLYFLLISVFVGVSSGSVISYHLLKLRPLEFLQNKKLQTKDKFSFSSALIIFQIIISITLLGSSLYFIENINTMTSMDRGFNYKDLLIIKSDPTKYADPLPFIEEVSRSSLVKYASSSLSCSPSTGTTGANWPKVNDPSQEISVEELSVGSNFIKTLGLSLLSGRDFDMNTDENCLILTESAVNSFGITGNALGYELRGKTVIGVVSDFHLQTSKDKILPVILSPTGRFVRDLPIRTSGGSIEETIKFLQNKWMEFSPDVPFNYYYYDDLLENLYSSDRAYSRAFLFFGVFSFIISLLGILGLSLFISTKGRSEIGIRKVNGARINDIIWLFQLRFIKLLLISSIISFPITKTIVGRWSEQFETAVSGGVLSFFFASIITILLVLGTVTLSTLKTAKINPIDIIKINK